jgi:hypothetical protein
MHTARSIQTAPSAAWSLDAFSRTFTGKAALVVCASLFVAACAHLIVPLPFTPVPLTLSDLAVLLVGLALGPELAFAALVLYLAEGAAGLPVFSPTGPGGLVQLFGFTGGYLLAYPFAAALAGYVDRLLLRRLPHVTRFAAAAKWPSRQACLPHSTAGVAHSALRLPPSFIAAARYAPACSPAPSAASNP